MGCLHCWAPQQRLLKEHGLVSAFRTETSSKAPLNPNPAPKLSGWRFSEELGHSFPLSDILHHTWGGEDAFKKVFSNKTSPSVGIRHNPIALSNKDAIVAFEIQKQTFPIIYHRAITTSTAASSTAARGELSRCCPPSHCACWRGIKPYHFDFPSALHQSPQPLSIPRHNPCGSAGNTLLRCRFGCDKCNAFFRVLFV